MNFNGILKGFKFSSSPLNYSGERKSDFRAKERERMLGFLQGGCFVLQLRGKKGEFGKALELGRRDLGNLGSQNSRWELMQHHQSCASGRRDLGVSKMLEWWSRDES